MEKNAKRMKMTLLVDFKDVSYFDPAGFVLEALNYLLYKKTGYWSPGTNWMEFLDEDAVVPSDRLIEIEEYE